MSKFITKDTPKISKFAQPAANLDFTDVNDSSSFSNSSVSEHHKTPKAESKFKKLGESFKL